MKQRVITTIALLCLCNISFAQYTIEQCRELSKENFPTARQRGLIQKSLEYDIKNASKGYVPQVTLSMRATIQTQVTTIPVPVQIFPIDPIPKDQYQAMVEVSQAIWDGGVVRSSKESARAQAEVQSKQLESDLYALNERVDNLFFGILLLDEQLQLNEVYDKELGRNYQKVKAYVESGVANSTDLDVVSVEMLNNRQQRAEITTTRQAYIQMLSALVGRPVDSLQRPSLSRVSTLENNRPELALMNAQMAQVEVGRKRVTSKNSPKIGAFIQGAYGNPGLDMLKNGFTPYAIGGIKLSWNFGGYYTQKNEMAKINLQKQTIETVKDAFLLNTDLATTQARAEAMKLETQIGDDNQIVLLRGNIKRAAEAKVAGGTLTVTDMMQEVTAENAALQTRALHQTQLLMAIYKVKNIINQ